MDFWCGEHSQFDATLGVTQSLGHPPVYMLYATLTPNGGKGWLIGQKVDLGVNWIDEKIILPKN